MIGQVIDFMSGRHKKPLWMGEPKVEDECRSIEADEEYNQKVFEYKALESERDRLKEHMEILKEEICHKLESEDAEQMHDCFGVKLCSYKEVVSNRFDTTLFKKDHLEMYMKYLKQSHAKTFRV